MEIKKRLITPLMIFVTGIIVLISIDYSIRLLNGNAYSLGLPEALWFSLQILITVLSFIIYFKDTREIALTDRIVTGSITIIIGITLYAILIYGYVIGTQVDGF